MKKLKYLLITDEQKEKIDFYLMRRVPVKYVAMLVKCSEGSVYKRMPLIDKDLLGVTFGHKNESYFEDENDYYGKDFSDDNYNQLSKEEKIIYRKLKYKKN